MAQVSAHRMVIPSQPELIPQVLDKVLAEVEEQGYDAQAKFAVRLALEEALTNAIHHGNRDDPNRKVRIAWQVGPRRVRIDVSDEGPGFNPDGLPDPTLEENLTRPGGRGVMLIRAYMDQVRFNRRGNRLTMVRRRNSPLPRLSCR